HISRPLPLPSPPASSLYPYTTLFRSPVLAVEPKILAEDLLVPVGALGANNHGIAVGSEFESGEAHGIEMVVKGKRLFLGLGKKRDRKSTRLNSSHSQISYAVFCLKKK